MLSGFCVVATLAVVFQDPPPTQEERPGFVEMLEDVYKGLLNRPRQEEEPENVLERIQRTERQLREIGKKLGDSETPKSEHAGLQKRKERLEQELKDLSGFSDWGAPGLRYGTWLDFQVENAKHVRPWLPNRGGDTVAHFSWGVNLRAVLDPSLRLALYGEQSRTWDAGHDWLRQQDFFDIKVAQVDVRLADAGLPGELSVGRIFLSPANDRMVGDDDWINYSRTFDGADYFCRTWLGEPLHSAYLDVQVLWGRPVTVEPGENNDRDFNTSDPDVNLYGLYAKLILDPARYIGMYVLHDSDTETVHVGDFDTGGRRIDSLGLRGQMPVGPTVRLSAETVFQRGTFADEPHRAHALHVDARFRMIRDTPIPAGDVAFDHFTLEYNFASGDEDPADGRHGSFHAPYPSAHNLHGVADLIGWRNMSEFAARLRILAQGTEDPDRHVWAIEISYHRFQLAEERDAYYGPRGEIVRRDPTGSASRFLGSEVDVELDFGGAFKFGWAWFTEGEFLSETGGGEDGSLFYVAFLRGF